MGEEEEETACARERGLVRQEVVAERRTVDVTVRLEDPPLDAEQSEAA